MYKYIQISETFGSCSLYNFRYVSVLDLKCLQEQGRNHLCFSLYRACLVAQTYGYRITYLKGTLVAHKGLLCKLQFSMENGKIQSIHFIEISRAKIRKLIHSLSRVRLFATPWTACSMPSFPVLHLVLEFAQTHVPWVGDAGVWPSHSVTPSLSALNLSQHQGLFQWVGSSYLVAKV